MDNVKQVYDIAIVGGGPAGLTAGLYARRANRSVLILEKATFGGQITFSPKVKTSPDFPFCPVMNSQNGWSIRCWRWVPRWNRQRYWAWNRQKAAG